MLKQAILNNWRTDIPGYAQEIELLKKTGFPAWTISYDGVYGVALPYAGKEEITEKFASARIHSGRITLTTGEEFKAIILTTESEEIKEPFSVLCEALVEPGDNGNRRKVIENNPLAWWKEWKELLGNRNIDERIYDVLGELCALQYSIVCGEEPEWNGPNKASYDIETESRFIEVKSTINREKRQVTISSEYQLFPKEKPLKLILCVFEPTVMTGRSIDSVLDEIKETGFNTNVINDRLESMGFEAGMSARKKAFILHEMLLYNIDESFPRITPEDFIGGVKPQGIVKITYTADISELPAESILGRIQ